NDALEGQSREPRRVELDARPRHVDDLAELRAVRVSVPADLVRGERLARLRASRRIADHAGEVADDDDHLMAEILEVAQLAQDDRVAQMKIGRGGVEPQLDLERSASLARSLELLRELRRPHEVGRAASDDPELLVDRRELQTAQATGVVSHRFRGCKARTAGGGC